MFAILQTLLRIRITGGTAHSNLIRRDVAQRCAAVGAFLMPATARGLHHPFTPSPTPAQDFKSKMLQALIKRMKVEKGKYFPGVKRVSHLRYISEYVVAGSNLNCWMDVQLETMERTGNVQEIQAAVNAMVEQMKREIDAEEAFNRESL